MLQRMIVLLETSKAMYHTLKEVKNISKQLDRNSLIVAEILVGNYWKECRVECLSFINDGGPETELFKDDLIVGGI